MVSKGISYTGRAADFVPLTLGRVYKFERENGREEGSRRDVLELQEPITVEYAVCERSRSQRS